MKTLKTLTLILLLAAGILPAQFGRGIPPTFLSQNVLAAIIYEASGDMALQNEILISGVNVNRKAEEYANGYFEPKFLIEKLREYGITDARIIDLPATQPKLWDAVSAELWVTKPSLRKIADLDEVPASLCSGSSDADVTAELVYVGPGNRDSFYEGKDVKGKIVLVNGYAGGARALAVEKLGAAGIVAYGSSHPEFDPDQVGWSGIGEGKDMKPTFGIMVSTRQGNEFRDQLERGQKIELRAVVKAQMVPYKEQMVEALIKGTDLAAEELVFTAHLYEGYAKQGANDDISGCVALLETARVLQKLVADGKIPPLRRSVRFLFVPEIEGTIAYLKKFPEIGKRFFANINEDMVGESLARNRSFFCVVQTPWSLPTWLNDVMRVYVDWMIETQRYDGAGTLWPVWSPTGTRDPFPAVMDAHSGGSDHIVFVDGGVRVPAVMFICWPDMWYHSSGDTPDKSDSTQLKRVVVLSTASAVTLAGAGPAEAEKIIAEVGGRGLARIGLDKIRAERRLRDAAAADLHTSYKDARNILAQGFVRETATLESTRFFIKSDAKAGLFPAESEKPARSLPGAVRQGPGRSLPGPLPRRWNQAADTSDDTRRGPAGQGGSRADSQDDGPARPDGVLHLDSEPGGSPGHGQGIGHGGRDPQLRRRAEVGVADPRRRGGGGRLHEPARPGLGRCRGLHQAPGEARLPDAGPGRRPVTAMLARRRVGWQACV